MKVRSTAKPAGKEIFVELSEDDFADMEGFTELPFLPKWQAMSKRADFLLVEYMLRRGDISKEMAGQLIREIQSGEVAGS